MFLPAKVSDIKVDETHPCAPVNVYLLYYFQCVIYQVNCISKLAYVPRIYNMLGIYRSPIAPRTDAMFFIVKKIFAKPFEPNSYGTLLSETLRNKLSW